MVVNNTILYALLGLIYLAKNTKRSVKIGEIAKAEKISVSFLHKVFHLFHVKKSGCAFQKEGAVKIKEVSRD